MLYTILSIMKDYMCKRDIWEYVISCYVLFTCHGQIERRKWSVTVGQQALIINTVYLWYGDLFSKTLRHQRTYICVCVCVYTLSLSLCMYCYRFHERARERIESLMCVYIYIPWKKRCDNYFVEVGISFLFLLQ